MATNIGTSESNFAVALLQSLNIPVTRNAVADIMAWENSEVGTNANYKNRHNPLSTTWKMPGSYGINSNSGYPVQAYKNWADGLQATVKTLNNGQYSSILTALRKGVGVTAFGKAVSTTSWGTKSLTPSPLKVPKNLPVGIGGTAGVGATTALGKILAALDVAALSYLGTPYVYGGSNKAGIDCSGLTMEAYKQIGITLPHSASAQYDMSQKIYKPGQKIDISKLQPGDLLMYMPGEGGNEYGHVTMYIGGGKAVQAAHTGTTVATYKLSDNMPVAVGRIVTSQSQANKLVAKKPSSFWTKMTNALTTNPRLLALGLATGVDLFKSNKPTTPKIPGLSGLAAIGNFANTLGQSKTWIRVAKIAGGTLAIGMGAYLLTKETAVKDTPLGAPARAVSDVIPLAKTAAEYAIAPEAKVTETAVAFKEGAYTMKKTTPKSKRKPTTTSVKYTPRESLQDED